MTFEQIVSKVKEKAAVADASSVEGTVAIQVNLSGKNVEGIFYIEVKDHNVSVEPYEYYDRNAIVTVNPTNLNKLIDGKLDPVLGYTLGKIKVEGDAGAALSIINLVR